MRGECSAKVLSEALNVDSNGGRTRRALPRGDESYTRRGVSISAAHSAFTGLSESGEWRRGKRVEVTGGGRV